MFASILSSALAGWLWRRVQEVGGLVTVLLGFYEIMPPQYQALVVAVLAGQGGGISIAIYGGFAVWLFSQFQSLRATIKPQVVTTDGTKIALPKKGQEGAGTTRKVEALAEAAPAPRTLWDRITGR